jgi:tripartite ATP-independent transporter DctP family solute receptor
MKKTMAVILSTMMAAGLMTGCGSSSGTSAGNSSTAATTAAPAASESAQTEAEKSAPDKVYTCVAALHTTAGGVEDKAVQAFAEKVKEKTNGGIDVQVYSGASLGTEQENMTQIRSGEIQFALFGDVFTSQLLSDYNATLIPFVFDSEDSALGYWESVKDEVDKAVLDQGGMYIVGREYRAPRQLSANREIKTPDDLTGLKLRVPETSSYLTVWNGLGAVASTVNWSEIYTALQTNVVEAQENPIETFADAGLQDVQSYIMMTNHIYSFYTWAVNAEWFDSLPDEYKAAWNESAEEALAEVNGNLTERQEKVIETLKEKGVTFVDVDNEVWKEAAMDYIKQCADQLNDTAKEAVYAQLNK